MTSPVQIPADVDREDRLLGELTARQLIILALTAVVVYLVWTLTGPTALILFTVVAAPLGLIGLVLAFGRRDGVSADRLLRAALTQRRQTPRAPHPARGGPGVSAVGGDPRRVAVARRCGRSRSRTAGRAVAARVPARRVLAAGPDLGVIDLGRDGWAVVCTVTSVNFSLRSGPERDALLAGFARWLHSLASPVQILTRTHPVDLSATITRLRRDAARLPHPALTAAAAAHADHLQLLGTAAELLHREFLIVFRTPTITRPSTGPTRRRTPTRPGSTRPGSAKAGPVGETTDRATQAAITQLRRRTEEAVTLLGGIGLRVTPLDPAAAARVLRSATRPDLATQRAVVSALSGATMTAPPPGPPAGSGSATRTPPQRVGGPAGGVGFDDAPTIELDLASVTAAAGPAVGCGPTRSCAINSDLLRAAGGGDTVRNNAVWSSAVRGNSAPADRMAGDDDEIERANTAAVHGPDPSDAAAMAAAIAAALDPHPTATAVGDVPVPEDMTLQGDEDPDSELTPAEARHDAAQPGDAQPADTPLRPASRPIGTSTKPGSTRPNPAHSPAPGRGPSTRSTRRRP